LKKIAREKELREKKHHTQNGRSARKSTLLCPMPVRTAILKSSRRLSSKSRASMEKKSRKTRKLPVPKRLSLAAQTPPMNPYMIWKRVKGSLAKKRFAQLKIRIDSKGKKEVKIKDSESDDDRKMPAKISRKKPKKVAGPMDTESSEETDEVEDYKASTEEKAFLKSIDKKENSDTDSD
jgi:hypothetical protein